MDITDVRYNYSKLTGLIKERYGTQEHFAEAIGMGRVSLNQRLNNRMQFRQSEIRNIMDLLEIPKSELGEYFYQIVEMDNM